MTVYAYVRVSTKEQKIERQLEAIKEYDISNNRIYCDYQSGKDFDRPEYKKLKKKLKEGDLLIIKSIDRLGRNYSEILDEWKDITKGKKVDIKVLDMDLLDTRQSKDNVTGILISDLLLQLLAYVAQIEREFIKQRQAEGIAAAKAKGVKLGRPVKEVPDNFDSIVQRWQKKELPLEEVLYLCRMSKSTFYRKVKIQKHSVP